MSDLGLFDLDSQNDDGTYNLSLWTLEWLGIERNRNDNDNYVFDAYDAKKTKKSDKQNNTGCGMNRTLYQIKIIRLPVKGSVSRFVWYYDVIRNTH